MESGWSNRYYVLNTGQSKCWSILDFSMEFNSRLYKYIFQSKPNNIVTINFMFPVPEASVPAVEI
jgi:hypothetical protein